MNISRAGKFVIVAIAVIFLVTTTVASATTMDDFGQQLLFWSYVR